MSLPCPPFSSLIHSFIFYFMYTGVTFPSTSSRPSHQPARGLCVCHASKNRFVHSTLFRRPTLCGGEDTHMHMHMYMYIYTLICTCIHPCFICIHTCMDMYMHVCMYTAIGFRGYGYVLDIISIFWVFKGISVGYSQYR